MLASCDRKGDVTSLSVSASKRFGDEKQSGPSAIAKDKERTMLRLSTGMNEVFGEAKGTIVFDSVDWDERIVLDGSIALAETLGTRRSIDVPFLPVRARTAPGSEAGFHA
jgi:hypothetical protein